MATKIKQIATHVRPHLDEILAIWILRMFGALKFPGIETAEIIYWDAGSKTPDGRSAEEWLADGVLCVGVGGGMFDEHPNLAAKEARREEECSASLVAKFLGVDEHPALMQLLKVVTGIDTSGGGGRFGVDSTMKLFYAQGLAVEAVAKWVEMWISAHFSKMDHFHTSAKAEFEKNAKVIKTTRRGQPFVIAAIESNHDSVAGYARSSLGCGADLVIIRKPNGQTFIQPTKRHVDREGRIMVGVTSLVRKAEFAKKGGEYKFQDEEMLKSEGSARGSEEWFFHMKMQSLMNGSNSAPNVKPSSLSLEEVVTCVIRGLGAEVVLKSSPALVA